MTGRVRELKMILGFPACGLAPSPKRLFLLSVLKNSRIKEVGEGPETNKFLRRGWDKDPQHAHALSGHRKGH